MTTTQTYKKAIKIKRLLEELGHTQQKIEYLAHCKEFYLSLQEKTRRNTIPLPLCSRGRKCVYAKDSRK